MALPAPLNGPGDRGDLWLSTDQLTAWFDSDVTADGGTDSPSITADGLTMYGSRPS